MIARWSSLSVQILVVVAIIQMERVDFEDRRGEGFRVDRKGTWSRRPLNQSRSIACECAAHVIRTLVCLWRCCGMVNENCGTVPLSRKAPVAWNETKSARGEVILDGLSPHLKGPEDFHRVPCHQVLWVSRPFLSTLNSLSA